MSSAVIEYKNTFFINGKKVLEKNNEIMIAKERPDFNFDEEIPQIYNTEILIIYKGFYYIFSVTLNNNAYLKDSNFPMISEQLDDIIGLSLLNFHNTKWSPIVFMKKINTVTSQLKQKGKFQSLLYNGTSFILNNGIYSIPVPAPEPLYNFMSGFSLSKFKNI